LNGGIFVDCACLGDSGLQTSKCANNIAIQAVLNPEWVTSIEGGYIWREVDGGSVNGSIVIIVVDNLERLVNGEAALVMGLELQLEGKHQRRARKMAFISE
jgi:hypothetical protein